jgi:succinate-semialdehyde dehydrogenase / glutarate-semialdehyde dehydrogenase
MIMTLRVQQTAAFYSGSWQRNGAEFEVISPSSAQVLARVTDCGQIEARQAADAAVNAFQIWKRVNAYDRSRVLRRWFELIVADKDQLAWLIASEMGKPITEAGGEVLYAASFVEWYAEEAKRISGEIFESQSNAKRLMTFRQPVGPVFAVTPWNFPAAMIARKAAPALAAGCSMVLKPAEQSPLTALRLAELWQQAGGEPNALQVLPTSSPAELSQVFFDDARIRKLTFTGSTEIGQELAKRSSQTLKRVSLELGGHAPFIVFKDADIEAAVLEVMNSKFRNAGQTCVCANRIFVHQSIADAFAEALIKRVQTLKVGDPLEVTTQIGPLVDAQGLEKVQSHVADAQMRGANVITGGNAQGLYFEPTVITDVTPDMRIMKDETFGPVAPIISFTDDARAIELANDTPFGLAAYLWTRDLSRAIRTAEGLEYGIIGINDGLPSTAQAPFGGMKFSGYGREGGRWGLDEYLETKYVSIKLAEE